MDYKMNINIYVLGIIVGVRGIEVSKMYVIFAETDIIIV